MRTHAGWILASVLMALAIPAPGLPQASSAAASSGTTVKLDVVFTRGEGDKKIRSPYSLPTTSGVTGSLRMGAEVPVSVPAADGKTRFTVQQVGMQIDYLVNTANDGRFSVKLTLSGHYLPTDGQPRAFTSSDTVTLRDGESTTMTKTDEKGEAYTVEVALTVVK
jgi:hypothetical protein